MGATGQINDLWSNPRLTGQLVMLRPFVDQDLEPAREMVCDPVANDLTATRKQFTFDQIREWYTTRNDQSNRIDLAIVERGTEQFAGEVVLNEYNADEKSCSFRISLRSPAWFGRGLGTEATSLVVDYGLNHVGLRKITLEVLARNTRAQRVYEKVGFEIFDRERSDGGDWIGMVITRATRSRRRNNSTAK